MSKKWKNKKVKLLSFQKDLAILLAEYDYDELRPELRITNQGIVAINTVIDIPQPQKLVQKEPSPKGLGRKTKSSKPKAGNVK